MNNKKLLVIVTGVVLCMSLMQAPVFASDSSPLTRIKRQIDDLFRKTDKLQSQINNASMTPGPRGPQGPAGQQGQQGPAGPTGPQGPQGTAGRLTTYRVTSPILSISLGGTQLATATCSEGDQLLSGGFFVQGSTAQVTQSRPAVSTEAWQVEASTANPPAGILPGIGSVAAYAWCNDLTP